MRYDIITTLLFGGLHRLLRQAAARLAGSTNKTMLAKFRSTPGMMAPLGDVLHRGVVVDAPADQTLAEGMIYMAFTPPVTKMYLAIFNQSP